MMEGKVEQCELVKMEYAVQMDCSSCGEEVKRVLQSAKGISSVYVDVANDLVLVETARPSAEVKQLLESTGQLVVFRGYGAVGFWDAPTGHHGAAVAIFQDGDIRGMIRLVQADEQCCVVEGTIDGLQVGCYQLQVHEYGDLSEGCHSCGAVFGVGEDPVTGDLGKVQADANGRTNFRIVSQRVKVHSLIGRSLCVHSVGGERSYGSIIARSAGVFQNSKRVCTCDGVTLWDEAKRLS